MDRVQASEAWGRGFESPAARQKILKSARALILELFNLFADTTSGKAQGGNIALCGE